MTTFAFTHKLPDDRLRKKSTQNFRVQYGEFCIFFDLGWIRPEKDPKQTFPVMGFLANINV